MDVPDNKNRLIKMEQFPYFLRELFPENPKKTKQVEE